MINDSKNNNNATLNNIKADESVSGVFIVKDVNLRLTKSGNAYISALLQDSTGLMPCKLWSVPQSIDMELFSKPSLFEVSFTVSEYNGQLQATLKSTPKLVSSKEEDLAPYMVRYINAEQALEYVKQTKNLINMIKNDELRQFVIKVFTDLMLFDEDINNVLNSPFVSATAAVINHHVGYGGLLVHSFNTAIKAYTAAGAYGKADKDLCIVGGLLHDIGKMESYEMKDCTYKMSLEGSLLDHPLLGCIYIDRYSKYISKDKLLLLKHIIASHHGRTEMGAIKEPMTLEANIVANADMGDFLEEVVRVSDKNNNNAFGITKIHGQNFLTYNSVQLIMNNSESNIGEIVCETGD